MTSPSLPPFITRSNRRVYSRTTPLQSVPARPHRKPNKPQSFLERHGDLITFIWSCALIAAIVLAAFS
ncbi:MAG: hypothetical protein ACO27M_02615 [Vulcanococcus sp.]